MRIALSGIFYVITRTEDDNPDTLVKACTGINAKRVGEYRWRVARWKYKSTADLITTLRDAVYAS